MSVSLTRRTLTQIAIRVGMVIIGVTAASYFHITGALTESALDNLAKYVAERGERESQIFLLAESNVEMLKRAHLDDLAQMQGYDPKAEFDQLLERSPDGAWRRRRQLPPGGGKPGYDSIREAGAYVAAALPITPDVRRRIVLANRQAGHFGQAWNNRFVTTYIAWTDGLFSTYWPGIDWAADAPANLDIPNLSWVTISNHANNPLRKTVWTGIWNDEVAGGWFATCVTPFDIDGRFAGYVGTAVTMDSILKRAEVVRLAGTRNLIFRADGRLISHPDLVENIRASGGAFNIAENGDAHLKSIYKATAGWNGQRAIIENAAFGEYLGISRISGPDWLFVTLFPKEIVTAKSREAAQIILLLGFASLLLELLIFYVVLRQRIIMPLAELTQAAERVAEGDLSARVGTEGGDELARLASAFNAMTGKVEVNSRKLEQANRELSESQAALKASVERFERALAGATSALWEFRPTSKDFYLSPRFKELLGWKSEDQSMGHWEMNVHPDDREMVEAAYRAHLEKRTPFAVEYRLRREDGCYIWVAVRGQAIFNPEGQPIFMSGSLTDITEKREAEELRRIASEAQAANRAKSDFLAMMSHEIRTPLNGMIGVARLALDAEGATEQRQRLETVLHSGKTLLAILNDILDLSKLEAGRVSFEARRFDVRELLGTIDGLVAPQARGKGIGLSQEISPETPRLLIGDSLRLHQILLNLLSNAVKFTAEGGVTLRVAPEHFRGSAVTLRFEVEDSGIGMDKAQLDTLFTPFAQADDQVARRFGGTGLGLAISKRLVEQQGGTIGVESRSGQGSRFWFSLSFGVAKDVQPHAAADERFDPGIETSPPAGRSLRILVAEDNELNRQVAQAILRHQGHHVTLAENGQRALEALAREDFDAVMMDMRMPGMDGLEAARRIRAMPPPKGTIPIIAVTANVYRQDIEACREAGMNAFLAKPIDVEQVKVLLDDIASRLERA
jgi:PAS domain S-box-containing protein